MHLCLLFNALLMHSFVPSDFHTGIIVPLLKNKHGDATQLDMYREITVSPVLSKLFESVLLNLFVVHFTSGELQFCLKKVVAHMHCLLLVSISDTSQIVR